MYETSIMDFTCPTSYLPGGPVGLTSERKVRSRERLGGLLRFYHREAA